MARQGKSEPLSIRVGKQLRKDILAGQWAPGQQLQLLVLSEHYEVSSTVIREALTHLSSSRLIERNPNHGFFVPKLSAEELQDFNELRCRIEEYGIQLSIERGDLQWSSEVFAAYHVLSQISRFTDDKRGELNPEWVEAHGLFHEKLLSACGLPELVDFAAMLADQNTLHRRWSAHSDKSINRDIDEEHQLILQAVIDKDAKHAGQLLREHYTKSMEYILEVGFATDLSPSVNSN